MQVVRPEHRSGCQLRPFDREHPTMSSERRGMGCAHWVSMVSGVVSRTIGQSTTIFTRQQECVRFSIPAANCRDDE